MLKTAFPISPKAHARSFVNPRVLIGIRLLVLTITLTMSAACSSHSLKGTPIWGDDYHKMEGPVEDRVNLWPLAYYRKPALSVLWPLITVSDEGHSFYPFYEYGKEKDRLRVGALHPWLPSLVDFDNGEQYWRVLNVARDRQDEWFTVFPLVYGNDELVWNPLFTTSRGKAEPFRGVLGPLFFYSENRDSKMVYAPFPLVGTWWGKSKGFQAIPLVYFNKRGESRVLNIGALLYHRRREGATEGRGFFLFPLGWFGQEGERKWNQLIPLWMSRSEGEEKNRLYSLFWTRVREGDDQFEMIPPLLYADKRSAEERWTTYLFPIFHRLSTKDGKGITIFPLFSRFVRKGGQTVFYSLPFSYRTGEMIDVMGPVFYRREKNGEGHAAVLWPLFQSGWSKDRSSSYAFPFYYTKRDGPTRTFYSLPYSFRGGEWVDVLGPVYFHRQAEKESNTAVVWPLHQSWRQVHDRGSYLFPLWYANESEKKTTFVTLPYTRIKTAGLDLRAIPPLLAGHLQYEGRKSFLSPLLSFSRNPREMKSSFFNLGILLFHTSREEDYRNAWALASIFGYSAKGEKAREYHVFPFFWRSSFGDPERTRWRVLLGPLAYGETRKGTVESNRAGLRDDLAKQLDRRESREPCNIRRTRTLSDWRVLLGLAGHRDQLEGRASLTSLGTEKIDIRRVTSTWSLLWYSKSIEKGREEKRLLWRVYDSITEPQEDGQSYSRQRVLWRLYHRESLGNRTSTDVFPFLTFDRAPQLRKYSLAGGLAEYREKDGARQAKLLWIPIGLGKNKS